MEKMEKQLHSMAIKMNLRSQKKSNKYAIPSKSGILDLRSKEGEYDLILGAIVLETRTL